LSHKAVLNAEKQMESAQITWFKSPLMIEEFKFVFPIFKFQGLSSSSLFQGTGKIICSKVIDHGSVFSCPVFIFISLPVDKHGRKSEFWFDARSKKSRRIDLPVKGNEIFHSNKGQLFLCGN